MRSEQGRTQRKSAYYHLHNKKKEVQAAVSFVLEATRALRFNVFKAYTGATKKENPNYLYTLTPTFEVYKDTTVMWIDDIKPLVKKWLSDYETKCRGTWARRLACTSCCRLRTTKCG
jgi:hypothetical protein